MAPQFAEIASVTLNLFQGPFLRLDRPVAEARWMLKQVQHDGLSWSKGPGAGKRALPPPGVSDHSPKVRCHQPPRRGAGDASSLSLPSFPALGASASAGASA